MLCSYYSYDRSGAQLFDILQNYYYCFKNNLKYGGPIKHKKSTHHYTKSIGETNKLINFLNLPFANNSDYTIINQSTTQINKDFNKPFRDLLFKQVKPNLIKIDKAPDDLIVCLHIRRGDVQKTGRWCFRYTDDNYYFELINEIRLHKPNAKIYLFSEKCFRQEERYDEYIKLGCIMKLDTELSEAFNYFIQCDIFIMASSAFSHVPAIYKKDGLVIYTWSKYFKPLDHWVDSSDINIKKKSIKTFIENWIL